VEPQSHPTHSLLERSFGTERGATAVEYGMLVALIAAVIIGTIVLLGPIVNDLFEEVQWW
jgi:pilus assembly protein Flp/PilA